MAWNEPGKSDQDPWGNSSKDQKQPEKPRENPRENPRETKSSNTGREQPNPFKRKTATNELDELLKKLQGMLGGAGGNGNLNGGITGKGIATIGAIAFIIWMLSGIYIVDTAERGVITRFGAFTETTGPGPHWRLPYPIESVHKVNIDRVRTAEIGYRSDANNRSGSVLAESLMLTRDENIIDLRIAVQYQVQDAAEYLFNVRNPDETLRIASESAIREIVGKNSMDFVLTQGRNQVVAEVRELTQKNLDNWRSGLIITSVNLQDAQPPEQVQAAFADVVKAREDRERLINEAEAYSNKILPEARGQAARIVQEAKAYRDQVIARSEGQASRFNSVVAEYKKAPEVMRERLYLEALTDVFASSSKVLLGTQEGSSNLLYLPLDKMVGNQQVQVPFNNANQNQGADAKANATTRPGSASSNAANERPSVRDFLRTRELR